MPVVITGRHRPHQVMLLAVSALVGAAYVVGAKPPGSLEQLMPGWVLWTWYVLLLASGLIGLAALPIRDPYRALVLERAAMWGQVAAPALYGATLVYVVGGGRALLAVAFFWGWSAASVWRGWQVQRGIRALRQAGGRS